MPMLHLDTGNTAFTLLCASLVMLMTPGLAFFYGGLVGRKNVLAIMMQSFVSMGWTTVLWWAFGFSLCFSGDQKTGTDFFGIIGNLNWAGLRGITLSTPSPNDTIPMLVFCAYQMMFAIITPALITGAFTNRITFKAYMLFLTAWLILVYFPFVHMVWGGGLLAQWGVKDFAGGIVVHNIAGIAALASILYVGKRKVVDRGPHSIPLVALGTGLLWFGWYGFNAGSAFRVDSPTAVAFGNHDIPASFCDTELCAGERGDGLFSSVCAFASTLGMLWIIDRITIVRVEDAQEELGLDEAIHGETAYEEVDVAAIRPRQPL